MMEVDELSTPRTASLLSPQEITCICDTWAKATTNSDIGSELVARLLNDNRTRFRALFEQKSGSYLGSGNYTPKEVMANRRAKAVADGVNNFFNTAVSKLKNDNFEDEIKTLSLQLGAMHFRMRVFFQAENWLCVKNCLLDSIIGALIEEAKESSNSCITMKRSCAIERSVSTTWFKFIQFVIQNMKKGFLAEALNADSTPAPETLSTSSSSEHSLAE